IEAQSIEYCRAGGNIGTVDPRLQPRPVDWSLGIEMGGQTAGQRHIQRDAKRLQLPNIGIECSGQLPGRRIEMPAGLDTAPGAAERQALDVDDTRRGTLPRPAD